MATTGHEPEHVTVAGLKGALQQYKTSISDTKMNASLKGVANGVATLDSAGKVPTSQLPSYVDDVLEYDTKSSFPTTGETGKIYVDKTTNKTWRWGGTDYVEISQSLALGETSSTAYAGDKGKALADKLATIETGAEVNVQSDWNATSGDAFIKNKPTIPAAQVNSDWNATSGVAQILNKPTIPDSFQWYGTSSTAADIVQKEVSIPSITTLNTGQIIVVKPTVTSTVADSTLKLNSFDAYPMRYSNAAITTSTDSIVWSANIPSLFVFDGSYWEFLGHGLDSNTTYSSMSVAEGTTGTSTKARSIAAVNLKQIIQALAPQSDWNATSGDAVILNKPTIPAAPANGTYTVKTTVGETTTTVSDFTANQSSADDVIFIQGNNVTLTPDATNRTITIAATDTTYSAATTSAAGLMSAADKTKLDGIATGYNVNDNVRTASQIGLIPNDSTKASTNATVLASLVAAGKSLFLDKDENYYITTSSSIEIGYDFTIEGKGTFTISGNIFKPIQGCSITIIGIKFINSSGSVTRLIDDGSPVNYQINNIRLIGCEFSGLTRVVRFRGADVNYSTTPFGIKSLLVEDCKFTNIAYGQFDLVDIVISDDIVVKNNKIEKFLYTFINLGTTNTHTNDNRTYHGDFIVDGNIVTGTVADAGYTYYCFVLAEVNRIIYTNNNISNLIGLDGPTYDIYCNSTELIYSDNNIKNVCNLPLNTETAVTTEIFKSKGTGKKEAVRNHWTYDFNECRDLVSSLKNVTYTDTRFNEINKVALFHITNHPADIVFNCNIINIIGGNLECATSNRPIQTLVMSFNVFKVSGLISGYMVPITNAVTQEVTVTDNKFISANTQTIELFGTPSSTSTATNNARVLCKNNDSTTPILNISSQKTNEFLFENNTYKNFPVSRGTIQSCYLGGQQRLSKTDFYLTSGDDIVINGLSNATSTIHCNIADSSSVLLNLKNGIVFDMYLPDVKKVYKIRNDSGTIKIFDAYGVLISTVTSSYSDVITLGTARFNAKYDSSDSTIIWRYYNSTVGKYDICIADPSLGLFDSFQLWNVTMSTSAPTSADGSNGDIWFVYEA